MELQSSHRLSISGLDNQTDTDAMSDDVFTPEPVESEQSDLSKSLTKQLHQASDYDPFKNLEDDQVSTPLLTEDKLRLSSSSTTLKASEKRTGGRLASPVRLASVHNTKDVTIPLLAIIDENGTLVETTDTCLPTSDKLTKHVHMSASQHDDIQFVPNVYMRSDLDSSVNHQKVQHSKLWKDVNSRFFKHKAWRYLHMIKPEEKKEMTKKELLKSYRLHFFVGIIFLVTVLSVSLSWHFRNLALDQLHSDQAIFFHPRTRQITLADPSKSVSVSGHLGQGIPQWLLPLHCPIIMAENPHFKECTWKKHAILRINFSEGKDVKCYNISWESLTPLHVPYDCYDMKNDQWYGPFNQSTNGMPISGQFQFQPQNYTVSNNGLFSSVVDFYWLSSAGVALWVQPEDPIEVFWNREGNNQMCLASNYSGPMYHQKRASSHASLNYLLCSGADITTMHKHMLTLMVSNKVPTMAPTDILRGSHWSLKGATQTENVTQEHILELLANITENGFQGSKITVDGNWQSLYGDLQFDDLRFSNLSEMLAAVTANKSNLTLSVSPYFQYQSQNFHEGVVNSMFVKDAGGEVTGLINFKGSLAAVVDVFTEKGVKWFEKLLPEGTSGIMAFRLTYGQNAWLPYKPNFKLDTATPNSYRRLMTELLGRKSAHLIVEHTSDSRQVASVIPVATEIELVNDKLCLTGIIEASLTLGLMGYPYVMADGFRVKGEAVGHSHLLNGQPSRELYIRWLQLITYFPAYQFSVPPWYYGEEVVAAARNASVLHDSIVLEEMLSSELQEAISKGLPLLYPVWWLEPKNSSLHRSGLTRSQFLIGNRFLVAPILCEGMKARDIYFPPGVWEEMYQKNIILGPSLLENYSVPESNIAVFRRKTIVGVSLASSIKEL